jgi:hypothetical protein
MASRKQVAAAKRNLRKARAARAHHRPRRAAASRASRARSPHVGGIHRSRAGWLT